jgi:hypothetical protein
MSYLGGANNSGSMPGRGLINPAFVIKIVPATDQLQQKPSSGRDNPNTDFLDNLKVGSRVKARVNRKTILGSVQRILKNELGDCTYVLVVDKKGKIHKIESTLIQSVGSTISSDNLSLVSTPVMEKFLTYIDFK